MLTASSITLQFAAKPLFENVNVKFGDGNRYGLIGANGCGKSTFMKILAGELEPSAGNVALDNLIFVINCNLQRLDGPVRGNGKMWVTRTSSPSSA